MKRRMSLGTEPPCAKRWESGAARRRRTRSVRVAPGSVDVSPEWWEAGNAAGGALATRVRRPAVRVARDSRHGRMGLAGPHRRTGAVRIQPRRTAPSSRPPASCYCRLLPLPHQTAARHEGTSRITASSTSSSTPFRTADRGIGGARWDARLVLRIAGQKTRIAYIAPSASARLSCISRIAQRKGRRERRANPHQALPSPFAMRMPC